MYDTGAQAIANWAAHAVTVRLDANWSALTSLGLAPAKRSAHALSTAPKLRLRAPEIVGFQSAGSWAVGDNLTLKAKGGGANEGYLLELYVD